jgi:anaerobic magnesium-protoporphyrin IX monomethyl ester cyclase
VSKVLLIYPPVRVGAKPISFPLGLAYVAAYLREHGHDVHVLDINGHRLSEDEVLWSIKSAPYDIIGIGGIITTYSYVKRLCRAVKEAYPGTPIVVGGTVASSIPELFLSRVDADIVVLGEGELTMADLLSCVEHGEDIRTVAGLWIKRDGRPVHTGKRERIDDLDALPMPAWDLLPVEIYIKNLSENLESADRIPAWVTESIGRIRAMSLISSRGCPQQCTFCYRNFGRKIRLRSNAKVIEEMRVLTARYGINLFEFADEAFTVNKKRTIEFCDALETERLSIAYRVCGVRVDQIDEKLMRRLKETGCYRVLYGIEHGSRKILDVMKKGVSPEDNVKAVRVAQKVGILCNAPMVLGMPGEDRDTIEEARRFYKKLGVREMGVFFATPYPGTELWDMAKQMGRIGDEEKFIETLGDASDFVINLTDTFTDEELHTLAAEIPVEVWEVCDALEGKWMKMAGRELLSGLCRIPRHIVNYGLLMTARKSAERGIALVGRFARYLDLWARSLSRYSR